MSFTIFYGLHAAAAEEYGSAGEALDGYRDLENGGARYLQIVEDGREIGIADLVARVEGAPT